MKREEWRNRVISFLKTGKTQAQWSKENNINPKQLSYWVSKFRKEDANKKKNTNAKFIKANIITDTKAYTENINIRIGCTEIELRTGFNKKLLVEIIETLRTVS